MNDVTADNALTIQTYLIEHCFKNNQTNPLNILNLEQAHQEKKKGGKFIQHHLSSYQKHLITFLGWTSGTVCVPQLFKNIQIMQKKKHKNICVRFCIHLCTAGLASSRRRGLLGLLLLQSE